MTREELQQAAMEYCGEDTRLQSAFMFGADYAWEHPHWIPVEERLPEKDGKYLFYDEVLGHEVSIYYDGVTLVPSVTHWMLLPKAPRKED